MRIANLAGRLVLVTQGGTAALDVERASQGRFSADPQAVYESWPEFAAWAAGTDLAAAVPFAVADLGAPSPRPRQVLAIGLNYAEHAAESGFDVPAEPTVMFTKWPTCLTGPVTEVELPDGGHTDWEVELVTPQVWLAPGDELVSYVAGIGELRQRFTAAPRKG
jgi:2,4-didehydro-3-deoxy-L-rhamnonate hydrolase